MIEGESEKETKEKEQEEGKEEASMGERLSD